MNVGNGEILRPVADLIESLRKLIAPFSDPVLKELGAYIAGRIQFINFKRSIYVLEQAKTLLADLKITPNPVELKILIPIIETAGLEDDEDLIIKWAGLLASASAGGEILPSYTRILAELSVDEVKILDFLFHNSERLYQINEEVYGIGLMTLNEFSNLSLKEYSIRILNLDRLGLIQPLMTGGLRLGLRYNMNSNSDIVGLTQLGYSFVQACNGPQCLSTILDIE